MDEKDNSRSSLQTAADLGRAAKAAYRIAQAAAVSGVHGAAAAAVKETVPALVKFLLVVLLIMIVIPMVVFTALPNIFFGYDSSDTASVIHMTEQAMRIGGAYMSLDDFERTQIDSIVTGIAAEYEADGTAIDHIEVKNTMKEDDLLWIIAINSAAYEQDLDAMSAELIQNFCQSTLSYQPSLSLLGGSTSATLEVEIKRIDPEELMEHMGFNEDARQWAGALFETLKDSGALEKYGGYFSAYQPDYSGDGSYSGDIQHGTSYDSVLHDEAGADTGDVPAELPEGDLSAEETAEQSETLPAMEAAEAKPLGLSTEEKTTSQDESDTAEERAEEAELHEEMSEFPDAEENLISDLPTSVPQVSEADEADWGFGEPVPEEAAAEAAEDEYLAAGNSEMPDAPEEKSERTLFYELDFNELDRGLSEEERKEWNSIYASFRGRSAITGTIIGVDLYARYLPRSEARMLENRRELCAVVVPYRIPILIRESEMWELGEERPDFVLRNMVGASIDVIVTKVERTANRAQASRRQASRSQRRFFAAREDLHTAGSRITCRMLAVGPRRCLVDCYGYDLDMTQREIRYAAIPDLRTEFHPGSEIDCIVKEYHPRTGELIVSAKETEVNPFFGAEERHPVGSRRFAIISGKYGGGVFCNLPDGVTCMCNYSYQHEDADFMVGEHVMLMVQRYDQEKLQMYGKIMSKW